MIFKEMIQCLVQDRNHSKLQSTFGAEISFLKQSRIKFEHKTQSQSLKKILKYKRLFFVQNSSDKVDTEFESLIFELVDIKKQNKQWESALNYLSYIRASSTHNQRASTLREEITKQRKSITLKFGTTIYSQWQRCLELQENIDTICGTGDLFEKSTKQALTNISTELIIKIKNILDQAFGFFVKEMILKKNKDDLNYEISFPVTGSQIEFGKNLQKYDAGPQKSKKCETLILDYLEKLNKKTYINVFLLLQKEEYITFIDSQSLKTLKDIPHDFLNTQPYFERVAIEFSEKIQKLNNSPSQEKNIWKSGSIWERKEFFKKFENKKMTKQQKEEQTRQREEQEDFTEVLKFLKEIETQEKQEQQIKEMVLQKIPPNKEIISFVILNRWPDIWKIFSGPTYSLKNHYPISYEALRETQPWSFYADTVNENEPGKWRRSWLEKVNGINNDSKHVRLTPQKEKSFLHERSVGTLERREVSVLIDFLEPRPKINYWSFVDGLSHLPDEDFNDLRGSNIDVKRVNLSFDIRDSLINSSPKFIDKMVMNLKHEQCKKIFECAKKNEPIPETDLNDFENNIKESLCDHAKPFVKEITSTIGIKILQTGHLSVDPDVRIDVQQLISNAMNGLTSFIEALALDLPECGEDETIQFISPEPISSTFQELSEKLEQKLKIELISGGSVDIIHFFQELTKFCLLGNKEWQWSKMIEILLGKADLFFESGSLSWLSEKLYRKALKYLKYEKNSELKQMEILERLDVLYRSQKRYDSSLSCIDDMISIRKTKEQWFSEIKQLEENKSEVQKEQKENRGNIEESIMDQVIHAKKQLLKIQYLNLKLASEVYQNMGVCDPHSMWLKSKLLNMIMETVIKVRQIFDQAYSTFIKVMIFRENDCPGTHLDFPIGGSEDELKKIIFEKQKQKEGPDGGNNWVVLKQENEKEDDDQPTKKTKQKKIEKEAKKLLDRDYPQCWKLVQDMQPYSRFEKTNKPIIDECLIWETLRSLCNRMKHVGVPIIRHSEILSNIKNDKPLHQLIEIALPTGRLYDWSFCSPSISFQESKQIYQQLKNGKIINLSRDFNTTITIEKLQKDDFSKLQESVKKAILEKLKPKPSPDAIQKITEMLSLRIVNDQNLQKIKESEDFKKIEELHKKENLVFPIPLLQKALQEVEQFTFQLYELIPPEKLKPYHTNIFQAPTISNKNSIKTNPTTINEGKQDSSTLKPTLSQTSSNALATPPIPKNASFSLLEHFEEIQILGNGNCQFRAFSFILFNRDENRDNEIRAKVIQYVKDNPQHFQDSFDQNLTMQKWIENMNQSASSALDKERWGDEISLVAAVKCFGLNLCVIERGQDPKWYQHDKTKEVVYFHFTGNHYNVLIPKETIPKKGKFASGQELNDFLKKFQDERKEELANKNKNK